MRKASSGIMDTLRMLNMNKRTFTELDIEYNIQGLRLILSSKTSFLLQVDG